MHHFTGGNGLGGEEKGYHRKGGTSGGVRPQAIEWYLGSHRPRPPRCSPRGLRGVGIADCGEKMKHFCPKKYGVGSYKFDLRSIAPHSTLYTAEIPNDRIELNL